MPSYSERTFNGVFMAVVLACALAGASGSPNPRGQDGQAHPNPRGQEGPAHRGAGRHLEPEPPPASFASSAAAARLARLPARLLWAWERPEDLRAIEPGQVGVALLTQTLLLRTDAVLSHPRMVPARFPAAATVVAVTRLESDPERPPTGSTAQVEQIVSTLLETLHPRVVALQIDFDARRSERALYRAVLLELRRRLPLAVGLSITALASWCLDDAWIADLPIDEAVPMLFRMGAEGAQVRNRLEREGCWRR